MKEIKQETAKQPLDNRLPGASAHFQSVEVPISPEELNRLDGAHAERRAYKFNGKAYLVTLLDGAANNNSLHSPVQCLLGEGWEIAYVEDITLPSGKAKLVKLRSGSKSMDLLYWYQGAHPSPNKLKMMMGASLFSLSGGKWGHRPVLISVLASSASLNEWQAVSSSLIPYFLTSAGNPDNYSSNQS